MPGGRPTKYNIELADLFCERIANGESMRSIGRDKDMPALSTIFKWLREHSEFSEQYAIAKEESAEAWADDIVQIADNEVGNPLIVDGVPQMDNDGKPVMIVDGPAVNHARLRVDSRKWAASKLKPKKYGDKIVNEHGLSSDLSALLREIDGSNAGLPGDNK